MLKNLQPIASSKTPKYRELVHAAIKDAILNGSFEPGHPLVEEQIAHELMVSRTPVREALAILEHEQLIAPRGGRGLFVREMTRAEFVERFVANEAVEPYLARRAALLATEAQLEEMAVAIHRGKSAAASNDIPGLLQSGREFHHLVGHAAQNAVLAQFAVRNEERTDLYLLSDKKILDVGVMEASNGEHEAILHAIAAHDPEAAARLVIYHAQSVRERFSAFFNGPDDDCVAPAIAVKAVT